MIKFSQNIEAWNALSRMLGKSPAIKSLFAVALLCVSFPAMSNGMNDYNVELTEEQRSILEPLTTVSAEYIELLNKDIPIPLITFKVSAARQTTNTDQFEILTSYNTMGFNIRKQTYTIEAPSTKGLDFVDDIKKKCQESPQQFFDNMIIDGALGFNVNW